MANKKKTSASGRNDVQKKSAGISLDGPSNRPPMAVEKAYLETGRSFSDAEESQMFGKPCFKINGKAFMSLFDNCVVFKLNGKAHETAMSLTGSRLFDPSGKGRAMKEWVQVSASNKSRYKEFGKEAMKYVMSTTE
jgi:hypothetical protein